MRKLAVDEMASLPTQFNVLLRTAPLADYDEDRPQSVNSVTKTGIGPTREPPQ